MVTITLYWSHLSSTLNIKDLQNTSQLHIAEWVRDTFVAWVQTAYKSVMGKARMAEAKQSDEGLSETLKLLNLHYESFFKAKPFADKTCHSVPCDTCSWSQIIVSCLTGLLGREREKGSDLRDGSDVKAANCWSAIDTPRFNGAIPAGRVSEKSSKSEDVSALDDEPYLFFVMWDADTLKRARCRIWCVRPPHDPAFREMARLWYSKRATGEIKSTNFQLHPPRFKDSNVFRNTCGNLSYPLLWCATRSNGSYETTEYSPEVMQNGECELTD